MICVFSPSVSGLQCLQNICGDHAAEHEITFNCNKTSVHFVKCSKWCTWTTFDQVKYLGVRINASLKDDDDIQRQVKSLYCAANKLRGTLDQCSPAVKTLYFVPIACQCMLANCGAKTSMKRLRAAYSNAYRIMHHIPRNVSVRPHQVSHCVRTFDALLRNNCIDFVYDAHLHRTFLFDCFNCLMPFTNLHFPSIIQRSCMIETKCSSFWWIVSVFASHQYCFCVVKRWTPNVYDPSIHKERNAVKCFAPLNVGHVRIPILQRTTVWLIILCSCAVAYAENFHWWFHSVANGGHLFVVCGLCDVTVWRHIHIHDVIFMYPNQNETNEVCWLKMRIFLHALPLFLNIISALEVRISEEKNSILRHRNS